MCRPMTTERMATAYSDPLRAHISSGSELKAVRDAERSGQPFVAYRDGAEQLVVVLLDHDQSPITIGRRLGAHLAIAWDGLVSGVHAELEFMGGEWTLVDDGLSTNGTFVNGDRISGRRRLRDADRIRVGRTMIAFNAAVAAPVEATLADGDGPSTFRLTDQQRRVLTALCRPYQEHNRYATPATNQQIADEVYLSVDAVKTHLRGLFHKFDINMLPQNRKRITLAETVLHLGVIGPRDF
jgi:pSer/pThr/pTyr-binding forkhead associated (FHA) protein